jgi:hypothetical protein
MNNNRQIDDFAALLPAQLIEVLEDKIQLGQTLINQLSSPRYVKDFNAHFMITMPITVETLIYIKVRKLYNAVA